jgi:hypothetical protein
MEQSTSTRQRSLSGMVRDVIRAGPKMGKYRYPMA